MSNETKPLCPCQHSKPKPVEYVYDYELTYGGPPVIGYAFNGRPIRRYTGSM